jgi:hypothetical protein
MKAFYSSETSVDFQGLHGLISQKIKLFITAAVRTLSPMKSVRSLSTSSSEEQNWTQSSLLNLEVSSLRLLLSCSLECCQILLPHCSTVYRSAFHILLYYGSTTLRWALAAFSVSWACTSSVHTLEREISPSQGLYLHTEHKHRINAHRHPCLDWDSNPRPQCLSGRGQFMT